MAEALLEAQEEEIQALLHVVTHDLREPLRAIVGFSQIIESQYQDRLDPAGRDYLARVSRAAVRMDHLIRDLGTLSRARRLVPPARLVRLSDLVGAALVRLGDQVRARGATVRVLDGLGEAAVDPPWGVEAICQLLLNGLTFSGPDRPPELEIGPWSEPDAVGLAVGDRGPGVPTGQAERIFRLFQRAVGREVAGTGAGLAIVRQVAQRHGGRAWVRPRAEGGAEFVLTFRRLASPFTTNGDGPG